MSDALTPVDRSDVVRGTPRSQGRGIYKPRTRRSAADRFIEKVHVRADGCWEWTAEKDPKGYGQFWNGERLVRPHRWIYAFIHGEVPVGLVVDHLCRNPSCCNPAHLEAVTSSTNAQRGLSGDLRPPAPVRASCSRGHSLEEFGHQRAGRPEGQMECRECRRLDWRRRSSA